MEKTYTPLVMPGWSNSPTAQEGHINDYLPGTKYEEDWDKAVENNDFISLFTVQDENKVRYYKILYSQERDSPIYIQWSFQEQDFPGAYDALDRSQAEDKIIELQKRLSVPIIQ